MRKSFLSYRGKEHPSRTLIIFPNTPDSYQQHFYFELQEIPSELESFKKFTELNANPLIKK